MTLRRAPWKHESMLDLSEKFAEQVKKGVPKKETLRRYLVDRAMVKRYCKQLDERSTLHPRKAPQQ
jgi:hypothetical protein